MSLQKTSITSNKQNNSCIGGGQLHLSLGDYDRNEKFLNWCLSMVCKNVKV